MRLILLGPPGAGKGTQAEVLSQELRVTHISTGNILRDAVKDNSPIGLKAREFIKKGELVPDNIVIEIVMDRIKSEDVKRGFILDGFPRTKPQAVSLDSSLRKLNAGVDLVIYFETSPEVSIKRLSGRRVCKNCGANYHIENIPPKKEGICDRCNGPVKLRDDDREETVRNRLKVYTKETAGLIDYYSSQGKLRRVSGDLEVNELNKLLVELFAKEKLLRSRVS